MITVIIKAKALGIRHPDVTDMTDKEAAKKLQGSGINRIQFKIPDFEWVSKELRKSGVTLNLLWVEYCEQCLLSGDMPYQVMQFKKYYVNAYEFFGGVTRILVPDNLKTGVDKNTRTETVVNKAYQELSVCLKHYIVG